MKPAEVLEKIQKLLHLGEMKGRFILASAVAAPILLLWLSLSYRYPAILETRKEIARIFDTSSEITRLKASWNEEESARAAAEWGAVKDKLIPSYEKLSEWLEFMFDRAQAAGIGMKYTIGEINKTEGVTGVSTASVIITLSSGGAASAAQPGGTPQARAGYHEYMDFLRNIQDFYSGADITGITMSGPGTGAAQMEIKLKVWVGFVNDGQTDKGAPA
ncbi:MAG: hypothetical protein HY751_11700 [Nitrospinae bacterium]|nr:hypothetical protein [Nitrospinota bacterium]